jgi:hypothetical protein
LFFYSRSASKSCGESLCSSFIIWLILNLLLAVYLKGAGSNYSCLLRTIPIWLLYRYSKGQYSTKSYFQYSCLVIVSSLHSNVPDRLGIKVLFEVHFTVLTLATIPRIWLFSKKMVVVRASFTDLNWFFVKAH